jgi:hypothetical protein
MIVLAVFFLAVGAHGIAVGETTLQPGPVYPFGPSQAYWGQSPAAIFIALGLGAARLAWLLFRFPVQNSTRKSRSRHR